jgi:hypothetical protein
MRQPGVIPSEARNLTAVNDAEILRFAQDDRTKIKRRCPLMSEVGQKIDDDRDDDYDYDWGSGGYSY